MSEDRPTVPMRTFTFSRGSKSSTKETQETQPWDTANSIDCHLYMAWVPIGRVMLSNDRLQFPHAERTSAVYRFRVRSSSGSEAVYFGETDDLERRFTHYRNPGPSQRTNIRLNNLFREALSSGTEIGVAMVAPGAWIDFGGGTRSAADFSSKPMRLLFENAAIAESHGAEVESESLNL